MTLYQKFGDKIIGKRIYAEFREYSPLSGPKEIRGTNRKQYVLKKTVQCWITKPLKKVK